MKFDHLTPAPADPILGLTEAFKNDTRSPKVNLGVGIFVDDQGKTPVLRCVKTAEKNLWETETSKSYMPIAGAPEFGARVANLLFGAAFDMDRVAVAQTPGGTGALRVGFSTLHELFPEAALWVPAPTWANHNAIWKAAGGTLKEYPYYDAGLKGVNGEKLCAALNEVPAGDIVLLHVCCHNPTGAEMDAALWAQVAEIAARRQWIPFFDFAYQGFGDGVEEDRSGMMAVLEKAPEALVASSFSKNLGLYGERVGALSCVAANREQAGAMMSHIKRVIRALYSNPPMHGGALVSTVLGDDALHAEWLQELTAMRDRIANNRAQLVEGLAKKIPDMDFSFLQKQKGMFSFSGLSDPQVAFLRDEKAIYIVKGGRINVAGLMPDNMEYVCEAIAEAIRRYPLS